MGFNTCQTHEFYGETMRTEAEIRDKIVELEAEAENRRKNPIGKQIGNMVVIVEKQTSADILKWALESQSSGE